LVALPDNPTAPQNSFYTIRINEESAHPEAPPAAKPGKPEFVDFVHGASREVSGVRTAGIRKVHAVDRDQNETPTRLDRAFHFSDFGGKKCARYSGERRSGAITGRLRPA